MNFKSMRTRHERNKIQSNKGTSRSFSGRTGCIAMSFWKAGCQQYRNGVSESGETFGSLNARFRKHFGNQIQGIEVAHTQAFRWRPEGNQTEQEMSVGRKPNPFYIVDEDLPVNLIATPEPSEEFQKRRDEVQDMIVRILLTGKKRGRPSKKEEYNEDAA